MHVQRGLSPLPPLAWVLLIRKAQRLGDAVVEAGLAIVTRAAQPLQVAQPVVITLHHMVCISADEVTRRYVYLSLTPTLGPRLACLA